jgi:regulator of replication initiation timing
MKYSITMLFFIFAPIVMAMETNDKVASLKDKLKEAKQTYEKLIVRNDELLTENYLLKEELKKLRTELCVNKNVNDQIVYKVLPNKEKVWFNGEATSEDKNSEW